jgi:hypothetical protein
MINPSEFGQDQEPLEHDIVRRNSHLQDDEPLFMNNRRTGTNIDVFDPVSIVQPNLTTSKYLRNSSIISEEHYAENFNICLLGDTAVGKSALA